MNEIFANLMGKNDELFITATQDDEKWYMLITKYSNNQKEDKEYNHLNARQVLNIIGRYKSSRQLCELQIKMPPYRIHLGTKNNGFIPHYVLRVVYMSSREDKKTYVKRYATYSYAITQIKKELGI